MSLFFLSQNLDFALQIFGALVFGIVSWLAFDAYVLRRDFATALRGVGFVLLAAAQIIHAFDTGSAFVFAAYAVQIAGIGFVVWNLLLSAPVKRSAVEAVLVIPALMGFYWIFESITSIGFAVIAFLVRRQYQRESNIALRPFWLAFAFLAASAFIATTYGADDVGVRWIAGHAAEFAGFVALAWWVWSYLQLRVREEMLLIFLSAALGISIIVSIAFSSIVIVTTENQARDDLRVDAKVMELTIGRMQQEVLSKARLLTLDAGLRDAFLKNDIGTLARLAEQRLQDEKLGILTFVDVDGVVVLRAHAPSRIDDRVGADAAAISALHGTPLATVASGAGEVFSVRATAPMYDRGRVVGAVTAGFPLDNALVDDIHRITGLEMSIYEGETRVATTALNPDGRTRSVGIKQTDARVRTAISQGDEITLRTTILSRPFLATFIPVKDADGKVVGMLSAAQSQRNLVNAAQATNRLTLIVVTAIMLALAIPIYMLTRRLAEEII